MLTRVLRSLISSSNDDYTFHADTGSDISLQDCGEAGLYLHIPFCRSLCPYCPYNRVPYRKDLAADFIPAVISEVMSWRERVGKYRFNSLYIGGGTPTLLLDGIEKVLDTTRNAFALSGPIAIETIPSDVTAAKARRMRHLEIEYVSLGVQSFNGKYLRLLGRDYQVERAHEAMSVLTGEQFRLLNVDLMFAFPGESIGELLADLRDVVAYAPQQVTCYPLFTFPYSEVGRYKSQNKLIMPPMKLRRRMYYVICKFFHEQGYRQSSVWSFTREAYDPYSSVSRDHYVGLGPSAGTYTGEAFYFNTFSVREYIEKTQTRLPIALKMRVSRRLEKLFWLYRRLYEIEVPGEAYRKKFGCAFPWDFGILLRLLEFLGLGRRENNDRLVLTPRGTHWIHLLQNQYALNYVSTIWSKCQASAWPAKVRL